MTCIALLRAVNLGGRNVVAMAALRDLVASLGFADVRTVLQSGNVVFRAPRGFAAAIERQLEQATATRLGVTTDYIVRTAAEWRTMIEANPFPREAEQRPGQLLLTALRDRPAPAAVAALQDARVGPELVRVIDRHCYIVYSEGIGRSRLTNALIEKKLGTRATGRNWNTVLKLATLASE